MAPSTARSQSWRPCTSEQTPILTEHHSDLLHSKVGLFRLTAVGHPRRPTCSLIARDDYAWRSLPSAAERRFSRLSARSRTSPNARPERRTTRPRGAAPGAATPASAKHATGRPAPRPCAPESAICSPRTRRNGVPERAADRPGEAITERQVGPEHRTGTAAGCDHGGVVAAVGNASGRQRAVPGGPPTRAVWALSCRRGHTAEPPTRQAENPGPVDFYRNFYRTG
jgi:hypothetical protein